MGWKRDKSAELRAVGRLGIWLAIGVLPVGRFVDSLGNHLVDLWRGVAGRSQEHTIRREGVHRSQPRRDGDLRGNVWSRSLQYLNYL